MKKLIILFFMFVFCSCGPKDSLKTFDVIEIPPESKEAAQLWVQECIKNANPYSDEEPEDMIKQCAWTAKRLFGVRLKVTDQCKNRECYRVKVEPGVTKWKEEK